LKKTEEKNKKDKIKKRFEDEEPEEGEENTTFIIIRLPDGERRLERRFYRTDTLGVSCF